MDRDNCDYRHQNLYQTIEEYNSSFAQALDFDQREFCAWTLLLDETPQRAALVIAMIFLIGCARVSSEAQPSACPPVVDYSRVEQTHIADEVTALPEGAMIVGWLADYAVLRDQVQTCQ